MAWDHHRVSTRWTVAAVVVALLGGACAGGDERSTATSPEPTGTVAPSPPASPPSTPAPEGPPADQATLAELAGVRVRLTEVATVDRPVAMAVRPGHDPLFVAERGGRVMVIDGGEVRPEPLLEVETTTDGERGLLGLAFSPGGDRLYVSYTDAEGDSRVEEYQMGEGAAEMVPGEPRTLLHVAQPFSNHNGGHVAVGPDGLLYVGLGDGGGAGDPRGNAQETETLLGSILRIDPLAQQGDAPYGIPGDNPFADGGGRGEIYVYGLRNPWRFSFDPATDDLWIADVGQNAVEEVNRLPAASAAGANMGWPALEGSRPFEGDPPPDAVPPVYEYNHDEGFSVTGGFVYRGERIPGLRGAYVFGDLGTARLWALGTDENGGLGRHDLGVGVEEGTLASFGEDADGELYVLSLAGSVLRLDPA
ncbi:MAG: PQQ-dependent sugar dehydrogenase [Actinobacteria bacterium]|nr:PQQ-dependent sugar dehydrogenase [Actinomycetota bacterium]